MLRATPPLVPPHARSYIELQYDFVTGYDAANPASSRRDPIRLPRTYLTYYDFDRGRAPNVELDVQSREVMQLDPNTITNWYTPNQTELRHYNGWVDMLSDPSLDTFDKG